ncbi:hypothetical protein P153DRAFT_331407 [Dothidotthia symphoricarpi CBS 119687]|uniref:INSIG domain-containing protein n=1 Tax=Dothidotthia symphoricarpi CBS 119687 TaxID=1392245 RepID=A0A6A6AQQ7_9PLEO|nr:uncharacterized protein P153DRAFT_331407 [Dothidotthia symphoricarpi CBS 119687]KAF2134322.1 hypothetical protein P153DRAFT_331407 [Dothidotthia symphoricarpi CBS 119687]
MAEDGFTPTNAAQDPPPIYRPIPRRPHVDTSDSPTHAFSHAQSTPPSLSESSRSSDFLAQLNARLLRTYNSREDAEDNTPPSRNKSFAELRSSTLSGIYDDVGTSSGETPWGEGAETPARMGFAQEGLGSPDGGLTMKSLARTGGRVESNGKKGVKERKRQGVWKYAVIGSKLAALWVFGLVYGLIISHLHDSRQLAAVHVELDREGWVYLASWGMFGVALGSLLPYVDLLWDGRGADLDADAQEKESEKGSEISVSEQINDVVRSVCAFLGIAFAIRRLPWQSTLQLTLTLALVNPALWYMLDRSKPGLSFSLVVTSVLTSFIFLSNPDVLPSPSFPAANSTSSLPPSSSSSSSVVPSTRLVSYENLAVVTWVGSVLFCSCVCFGSIGRRLGVLEGGVSKR